MLRVVTCTEIGDGRQNEDAFAVQPHPADPDCLLCALADGQGGQPCGGPAARLACRACIEIASRTPPDRLRRADVWAAILGEVDRAVTADPAAGLTTLIGLCVTGGAIVGASNGDSAAVLACAGGRLLTLTERQAKHPPVGSGAAAPTGFDAPLLRPWTLLVMTDGVWKYAGWEKVRSCAGGADAEAIHDSLRAAVRLRSGAFPDDFTLVVVQDK
jgi:serine/threonine protein phosphatase PrpC